MMWKVFYYVVGFDWLLSCCQDNRHLPGSVDSWQDSCPVAISTCLKGGSQIDSGQKAPASGIEPAQ